jgi:hypothetical protein
MNRDEITSDESRAATEARVAIKDQIKGRKP